METTHLKFVEQVFAGNVCQNRIHQSRNYLYHIAPAGNWDRRPFMRYLKRTSLLILFILWAVSIAFSQSTSQESKQGTGVISGRVTMGGTAARGVTVIAMPKEDDNPRKVLE